MYGKNNVVNQEQNTGKNIQISVDLVRRLFEPRSLEERKPGNFIDWRDVPFLSILTHALQEEIIDWTMESLGFARGVISMCVERDRQGTFM